MYKQFIKNIGITEMSESLLKTAFTHRSYINEHRRENLEHNERLEFLGDACLELVVTDFLFKNYPHSEGELTNWRSALVKRETLAEVAGDLELGKYLRLSRGEEASGGREKDYILANTVEAIIGALYIDQGLVKSTFFVEKYILVKLDNLLEKGLHIDAKSKFQEVSQEKVKTTPMYRLISSKGPDHNKCFVMGAYLGGDLVGQGEGSSKQSSEQAAARDALAHKGWENI